MINIENINNNNKIDATLGLIQNVPKTILAKLGISYLSAYSNNEEIEVIIITSSTAEELEGMLSAFNASYEDLGFGFGIVTLRPENLINLANIRSIQYIELPKNLVTSDVQSNVASCVIQAREIYNIRGDGVLVGFIDSGIDFTHPAFRWEDGRTRIDYIYDLSEGGVSYNSDIINEALENSDPYSVVPVVDVTGHGTHVSGIACAGGNISEDLYGVAPRSSIAMVKCTRGFYAISTNIMRGVRYLIDRARELNKPLVINISLSTNDGAHNGSSLLEQYISTIASLERVTIVIAAGNEGDTSHHKGGNLEAEENIYINISPAERFLVLNLYKSILPKISIRLLSPTGELSSEVIIEEGYYEGRVGQDTYQIFYTGPKPFDLIGEISIAIVPRGDYISQGQWEVRMKVLNEYEGEYDMWLPISEALNPRTRFLEPTVLNTLGIPATVTNIIAVGSYNYTTNVISSFSGRGREGAGNRTRPDLVAPGEDIMSTAPNRSFTARSGTSMATPNVSGIAALMMEWGLVRRNDLYLFGERLKYYLVISAKRPRVDVLYPDPSWGYGEVCLNGAMQAITSVIG